MEVSITFCFLRIEDLRKGARGADVCRFSVYFVWEKEYDFLGAVTFPVFDDMGYQIIDGKTRFYRDILSDNPDQKVWDEELAVYVSARDHDALARFLCSVEPLMLGQVKKKRKRQERLGRKRADKNFSE